MINIFNESFYFGGYFIVKPTPRPHWMNGNVIHEKVMSASNCLCDFYPDINIIRNKSQKVKEEYRITLGLDISTYDKMENWINEKFEKDLELPYIFSSYESAFEFYGKFLYNQNDLRIIGIALPNIYKDSFIEEQDDLSYGVCKMINKHIPINIHNTTLGYEILGYDWGGFHSYICNGLENMYYDKYKLVLNENGFISTLEEADILSRYTNNVIENKEPVLWLPWAILDAQLIKDNTQS